MKRKKEEADSQARAKEEIGNYIGLEPLGGVRLIIGSLYEQSNLVSYFNFLFFALLHYPSYAYYCCFSLLILY